MKSAEQQAGKALHRVRSRLIKSRTALVNEIRGLLGEFSLVMPVKGVPTRRRLIADVLEDGENGLPRLMRRILFQLSEELIQRDHEIAELDEAIKQQCKADDRIKRLLEIDGIGPVSASAVVAAIGDARQFTRCRDLSAWVGLGPHAAVRCGADQRRQLERLCRAISPAIANERLKCNRAGQVAIAPLQFMQRLAALVPRPRLHLIRFHSVA